MRLTSLIVLSSILTVLSCDTGNNVEPYYERLFLKYYGEDGNQEGVDLLVDADGSMILLGNSTVSQTNPTTIPFITKVDPLGNVLWQRQVGELNEKAVDVEFDNSNNLIVVSNYGEGDNSRVKVYRIGADGVGQDSVKVELSEKQVAKSVTITSTNRILVSGYAAPQEARNQEPFDHTQDVSDVILLEVDIQAKVGEVISLFQGGEYDGSGVKVFEVEGGLALFGYSDRPYITSEFKKTFEMILMDNDGVAKNRKVNGIDSQVQIASSALHTVELLNVEYLMVGTTYANALSSNIYIVRYGDIVDEGVQGIGVPILLNRRLEGVSAAAAQPDNFYILANETRENNKRDISLIKLATDGAFVGSITFGALEGDDAAGAVRVLPDGRIAIFGTMELETQKKMVLITVSPEGKFSN